MTKIDKGQPLVTLITVHICKSENQQQLVDVLLEAVNTTYRHLPGFISASIHKGLDGVRVTNYAQYRSREDFEAARTNPAILPHIEKVMELVDLFDAHLYEVVEVFHA